MWGRIPFETMIFFILMAFIYTNDSVSDSKAAAADNVNDSPIERLPNKSSTL